MLLLATTGRNSIWADSLLMCEAARSLGDHGLPDLPNRMRADVSVGADGRYYAKFPLLNVAGCLPAVALLRIFHGGNADVRTMLRQDAIRSGGLPALLLGAAPAALGATVALGFALLAISFGGSVRVAAGLSLLLIFTTPLWSYCRTYYGEAQQAMVYVWTMLCWFRARKTRRRSWLIAGGVLLGLAVNAKTLLVLLAPAAAVYYLWGHLSRTALRDLILFGGLGAVPGLGVALWHNAIRYDSPLVFGYTLGHDLALGFSTPLLTGLHGLLFSSGKSVFLYAPLFIPAAFLLLRFARRHAWLDTAFLFGPAAVLVVANASWWAWSGDSAWGPRLLVPLLPILLLPLKDLFFVAGNPADRRTPWIPRLILFSLALLGLAIQWPAILVHETHYLAVARRVSSPISGGVLEGETVRDDLLVAHFVPEFSPLIGQWWVLLGTFLGDDWARAHYPWRSLGLQGWQPPEETFPLPLNVWFAGGAFGWTTLTLLAAVSAWLAVSLRRAIRRLEA